MGNNLSTPSLQIYLVDMTFLDHKCLINFGMYLSQTTVSNHRLVSTNYWFNISLNSKKNLDFPTTEWASVPDGLTKVDKNNLRLNTTRYCTFNHRLLLYNSELSHSPGCTLKKSPKFPSPKIRCCSALDNLLRIKATKIFVILCDSRDTGVLCTEHKLKQLPFNKWT